jgi:hypothetical protein
MKTLIAAAALLILQGDPRPAFTVGTATAPKGATIGSVTDYLNRPLQNVTAPEAGVVMLIRAVPSLKKGDTIVNIGVVSTQAR